MDWLLKFRRPAAEPETKRLWIEYLAEIDPRYLALLRSLQANDGVLADGSAPHAHSRDEN